MTTQPDLSVQVDPTNPGQFFACCGLLELADRIWPGGAQGEFDPSGRSFALSPLEPAGGEALDHLLDAVVEAQITQLDPDDEMSSPLGLGAPFDVQLDWWQARNAVGERLKAWAGRMCGPRIARAMHAALKDAVRRGEGIFDYATVVFDPSEKTKKVEPFYFDARRGSNAHPIDLGFSPDVLKMTTKAYPAVEFLCLVGLQRFRPAPTRKPRIFEYETWSAPVDARIAPLAAIGGLEHARGMRYRFENSFRTDQRKLKAFTPATSIARI